MTRTRQILDGLLSPPSDTTPVDFIKGFQANLDYGHLPFGQYRHTKPDIDRLFTALNFDRNICQMLWSHIEMHCCFVEMKPTRLFKLICSNGTMHADSMLDAIRMVHAIIHEFSVMEHMVYKDELGTTCKLETILYYFTPVAQRLVDTCTDCRALHCHSGERLIEHLLFHRNSKRCSALIPTQSWHHGVIIITDYTELQRVALKTLQKYDFVH